MKKNLVMLGSLLVAYVLLTCALPVKGFLDDQGDEIRLTDNAAVEYDPVFYDTPSFDDDIENARIAYHDGQAVHLYDYPSDTDEVIYNAPEGYTITDMTSITIELHAHHGLLIALEGNGEAVIVQEDYLEFTEIFRENGEGIDNISCYLDRPDSYYILFEQNGEIYYRDMTDDDTFRKIKDGNTPIFFDYRDACLYVVNLDGRSDIYLYLIDNDYEELFYSDGSHFYDLSSIFNGIEHLYTYAISDCEGEVDIWMFNSSENDLFRMTEKKGVERDICAWDEYVVFVRTVDGQSDIYIVRGGYDYD